MVPERLPATELWTGFVREFALCLHISGDFAALAGSLKSTCWLCTFLQVSSEYSKLFVWSRDTRVAGFKSPLLCERAVTWYTFWDCSMGPCLYLNARCLCMFGINISPHVPSWALRPQGPCHAEALYRRLWSKSSFRGLTSCNSCVIHCKQYITYILYLYAHSWEKMGQSLMLCNLSPVHFSFFFCPRVCLCE